MRNKMYEGITQLENRSIRPQAWVYFVWAIINDHTYCKIGYTTNPRERITQVSSSIPTVPFFLQLLPCLNVQQAKLFEKMLHQHLISLQAKHRSEWFTHPNLNHLSNNIRSKVDEIVQLALTFGYTLELQNIHRPGPYPVLHPNGYIDYVVDPSKE